MGINSRDGAEAQAEEGLFPPVELPSVWASRTDSCNVSSGSRGWETSCRSRWVGYKFLIDCDHQQAYLQLQMPSQQRLE